MPKSSLGRVPLSASGNFWNPASLPQSGVDRSGEAMNDPFWRQSFGIFTTISAMMRPGEAEYLVALHRLKGNGFPEETKWLTEQLKSPDFRQTLTDEYAAFWSAYSQDRDLLRFHYHRPRGIWENLKDLSLPTQGICNGYGRGSFGQTLYFRGRDRRRHDRRRAAEGGKGSYLHLLFRSRIRTKGESGVSPERNMVLAAIPMPYPAHPGVEEDHDGKGLHYKKRDCPDVHFTWGEGFLNALPTLSKRPLSDRTRAGRVRENSDRKGAGWKRMP